MKIVNIPIEKIKRDEAQPRMVFNEQDLQELAESITKEGIINPLEIDPDFVIILGERRFRAAKLAGLTTVPATIKKIFPRERFIRQLNENLHTGGGASMVAMDIANAFAKILNDMEGDREENILWLAERVGKRTEFIKNMLELHNETGVVKTYLETPTSKYTYIVAANYAPTTRLQQALKEKIIKGEISSRDTVREIINAIERYPDREKQLLKATYTGKAIENTMKIHQIAPHTTPLDSVSKGIDVANKFQGLLLAMKGLNLEKISKYDMAQIKKLIEVLIPQANQIHARIYDIQQRQLQSGKKTANLQEVKE